MDDPFVKIDPDELTKSTLTVFPVFMRVHRKYVKIAEYGTGSLPAPITEKVRIPWGELAELAIRPAEGVKSSLIFRKKDLSEASCDIKLLAKIISRFLEGALARLEAKYTKETQGRDLIYKVDLP